MTWGYPIVVWRKRAVIMTLVTICVLSGARADVVVVTGKAAAPLQLSRKQVAELFLGQSRQLPNGLPAIIVEQPDETITRIRFHALYTGRSAAQLDAHWSRLRFAGGPLPPRQMKVAEIREFLVRQPAALAYVDRSELDGDLREVTISDLRRALRVVVSPAFGMPFYAAGGNAFGLQGIAADIGQAVADALTMPVTWVELPRRRVDLAPHEAFDLNCYSNPGWTADPTAFVWSEPLLADQLVLVGLQGSAQPSDLTALEPQARVGAVFGQPAAALDAEVAARRLRREDGLDPERVLLKLEAKRSEYGLVSAMVLQWQRQRQGLRRVSDWQVPVQQESIHCAAPHLGLPDAGRLIDAVRKLKRGGQIEAILARYRYGQ